jgi:hypothetical protein
MPSNYESIKGIIHSLGQSPHDLMSLWKCPYRHTKWYALLISYTLLNTSSWQSKLTITLPFYRIVEKIKEYNSYKAPDIGQTFSSFQNLTHLCFCFTMKSVHIGFSSLHSIILSFLCVFFLFPFLFLVPGQVWMIIVHLNKSTSFRKRSSMCCAPSMGL